MNIVVDDTDPSLTYSGQWNLFSGGSSRQWQSTVHSTFQAGAIVSFKFQGSVCKVYGTVPIGNGSNVLIDVTIDGSVSPIISRTTSSAANYANLFYQSSAMESTVWHTVVITNRGSVGNVDFQFDRVELDAPDITPSVSSFAPSPTAATAVPSRSSSSITFSTFPQTPTSTIGGVTVTSSTSSNSQPSKTSTQSTMTTTRDVTSVTPQVTPLDATAQASLGSAHTMPVNTIIGIMGGIIALLILVLFLILYRQRRKAKDHRLMLAGGSRKNSLQDGYEDQTIVAIPFTGRPSSSMSPDLCAVYNTPSRHPLHSVMSEKALQQARANRSENDREETSSRTTTLSTPTNATASVSVPSDRGTGIVSNFETWTSSPSIKSPSIPFSSVGLPPEPHRADVAESKASEADPPESTYRSLRYLSGSSSEAGPSRSAYGGTMESMYDVPPAYRPNK